MTRLLQLVLVVAVLAGCGGGTKAGGSAAPVTLRLGTYELQGGSPGAAHLEDFARRVAKESGGTLRIEPVWRAAGDGSDWDQRTARLVVSGELDMGLIPSRAWDTEGVRSLRAINAPFLITTDRLLAQVVSSDVATDMLSGLEQAGVVGVALFPDGLRHPFSFYTLLRGPRDYAGKAIRSPTSNTAAAVFAALGAKTNDDPPNPNTQAGMEAGYPPEPIGTAMGNVTFFAKANALVVNDEVYAGLDDRQREILAQAAAQTRARAIATVPDDAKAAKLYCRHGGSVALVSDADVAALEQATASVYTQLEQDPQTKAIINRIRALKAKAGAPVAPVACGVRHTTDQAAAETASAGEATPLDGAYRAETTEQELRARGLSAQTAYDNHGLHRLTFKRGALVISEENQGPETECRGVYSVSGSRLSIRITGGPVCPEEREPMTFNWTLGDGALRLVATGSRAKDPFIRVWWGSEPWMALK